ncbi:MAG: energy-coupling factor transporter ATPase [Clostridia bacterium]|nr:energy-coupling factor transporter ATPase [Clostridia bacterium]
MIDIRNVSFAYDDESGDVLRDVTLKIAEGSFTAVLGGNGSGKSTLAKIFNALCLPREGKAYVDGMDTSDDALLWDIRSSVGMIFQNPDNQIIATSVRDDVAFGLENLGVPPAQMPERISDALKNVDMEAYADKAPHLLSGGQKQRVAIAGILAMEPRVIICDEATAMLDPKGRREVFDIMKRLNREKGITVIWITHFMDEAVRCDDIILMKDGRVAFRGAPREIFTDPRIVEENRLALPDAAGMCLRLREAGFDVDFCLTVDELAQEVAEKCL